VSQWELYALPSDETAGALGDSLRDCGAALLGGDLAQLPLLERRIRDRARTHMIAWLGEEAAHELGW
jgi:hypothetical protein